MKSILILASFALGYAAHAALSERRQGELFARLNAGIDEARQVYAGKVRLN